MNRRHFLRKTIQSVLGAWLATFSGKAEALQTMSESVSSQGIPTRPFGRTGFNTTLFGFGGEGILRTTGRHREAVPVIEKALELGVNYYDTSPAYADSQDYYGVVFKNDPRKRKGIFLASKTHDRSRDGSLRLLDDSLRRLHTDRLDLWQLHDLRDRDDLNRIFSKGGALEALIEAKKQGRIRFLGITGHHDPAILKEAANRFPFDSVMMALNAADIHTHSFIKELLPAVNHMQMAVIGMKVYSRGRILQPGLLSAEEAVHYVWSLPVSNVILGCDNIRQVEENVHYAKEFQHLSESVMRGIEARTANLIQPLTSYKNPSFFALR